MRAVVIGGGLAGLMAARALRTVHPGAEVTLLERNDVLGGLLGGVEYPDQGLYFDLGTHIFQETGEAGMDAALLGAVPAAELIHFPVGAGDLAGTVFAGRLQANTHFPDVRGGAVEPHVVAALRAHVAAGGEVPPVDRTGPLLATAAARYGGGFAEQVVGPALSRAFGHPAEELAGFALLLPGWTRVVLDDHAAWEAGSADQRFRAVVAVPDQRHLPRRLHHGRRSFYARRLGSRAFIDGLAAGLRADGVRLQCGATITALDPGRRSVAFTDAAGKAHLISADRLVLATGAIGAAQLLGVDLASRGFDRPMPHWVVHVVLEEPCASDLCYLHGLDSGCDWYRVTNYRAVTGDVDDRRLTIEVVGRHDVDPATWPARLVGQLHRVGLLPSTGIRFADARRLAAGFPAPSMRNMRALAGLGADIAAALPHGVLLGGIGAGGGLFFQNEVVADLYRRVVERG